MRYKNESEDLKLYAVAGTQTVLLSFDIDKEKITGNNFLGFSIERMDKAQNVIFINGSKHFRSLIQDDLITDPDIKFVSLVQSFFWKDYTADPGEKYTYTVKAKFGTAHTFTTGFAASIEVTTEALHDGKHSVFFNYGVTGSQAYAKRFKEKKIELLEGEEKEAAFSLLGRELWKDGLVKFVQQAKDSSFQLFGAFYEFEYPAFLNELKEAIQRNAHVEIVYSFKQDQKEHNQAAIEAAGIADHCHKRTVVSQPHNKFMVLCKNNIPIEVWSGSTNITIRGIFGHSNTGHWIKDETLAEKYLTYWNVLKHNPKMHEMTALTESIQPDTDLRVLPNGIYPFFSPRKTDGLLDKYAELLDTAKEVVCMVFPFNFDERFQTVFAEDKDFLRFLLFEETSVAQSVVSNDTDLKVTAGAILKSAVEEWVKEITAKAATGAGILYVHNKFFIIDALSERPIVLSGSANFSHSSIVNNDENSLLIIGDKRVADLYLTEFNRLFEHFWPRYLRILHPDNHEGFEKPLDETFTWFEEYFKEGKFGMKRRLMFTTMKGVKEG